MKQQILEVENARLKFELEALKQDRDDWKTLAELYKPDPVTKPTMTDLMVDPETVPDYVEDALNVPLADYNGWTNRETWLIHIYMEPAFMELMREGETIEAEALKECVMGGLDDAVFSGCTKELVKCALASVNWQELADHYKTE